jgi:hypothetical protein
MKIDEQTCGIGNEKTKELTEKKDEKEIQVEVEIDN